MRQDMDKLFYERGRSTGRNVKFRPKVHTDEEFSAVRESMRRNYSYSAQKDSLFALRALKRFVEARVGQPWSEVYSEICSTLRGQGPEEIRDRIRDWVAINTYLSAQGEIVVNTDFRGAVLASSGGYFSLYVHPVTGLLVKAGNHPKPLSAAAKAYRYGIAEDVVVKVSDSYQYHLLNNIWYGVSLARADFHALSETQSQVRDAVTGRLLGHPYAPSELTRTYRKHGVFATRKNQLSKAELARSGLSNPR